MDESSRSKHEISPTEARKPRFFYGYIILVASFLVIMMVFGAQFSFGVFFKPMLTDFGWSRAVLSGAYSLYMVTQGIWGMVAGRLTDRFGSRLVVTIFGLFLGLGYILMSQVNAVWQIYLFYGILASAGSGCWVPILSTAARWFIRRIGLISGIIASGVSVGSLIVAPLASELIARYGWRDCYIIVGVASMLVIVAASQFLRTEPGEMGQFPDGASQLKSGDIALGVKGVSPEEAIRTRQFWLISGVFFSIGFCIQTVVVHIVPQSIDIGMSAGAAASVLAVCSGLGIVGRIGFGEAGDRIGNKSILVFVMGLISVALMWVQFASQLWMLYIFAVIFALGWGGVVVVQSPLVAEFFGLKAHGGMFGLSNIVVCFGGALGPLIAGYLFDMTTSYHLAFVICAVLSIASLIVSWKLKPLVK